MPGVALHQDRAAGGKQFGDQVRVFAEFVDEQVVHDGPFPRIPVIPHPDLAPAALCLLRRHGQKLRPIPVVRTLCRLKSRLHGRKGHAIEGHAARVEITQESVRASETVYDLPVLIRHHSHRFLLPSAAPAA